MTETATVVEFTPEDGMVVGLPEEPKRQRVVRGPQAAGGQKPLVIVVGAGGRREYVIRSTAEEQVDLEAGDVLLGVEPPSTAHQGATVWLASPASRYGGEP